MEIFDDMGLRDPEVGKFQKNNLKLSRPRFNFGVKQKSELQNFVLEGHPSEHPLCAFFCKCDKAKTEFHLWDTFYVGSR